MRIPLLAATLVAVVFCSIVAASTTASEVSWIGALPGVTLTVSKDDASSVKRTYAFVGTSSDATYQAVRGGLSRRGWSIRKSADVNTGGIGVRAIIASKGDMTARITVQGSGEAGTIAVHVTRGSASTSTVTVNLGTGTEDSTTTVSSGTTSNAGSHLIINDNHREGTYQCDGSEIIINGNHAKLRLLGRVDNSVVVDAKLGDLVINGNHNSVRWSKQRNPADPDIVNNGNYNRVDRK